VTPRRGPERREAGGRSDKSVFERHEEAEESGRETRARPLTAFGLWLCRTACSTAPRSRQRTSCDGVRCNEVEGFGIALLGKDTALFG
jgi:hypothetical protein